MKKLCFLAVVTTLFLVLNTAAQASHDIVVKGKQGRACDARDTNADGIAGNDVMGNATQLMTRSGTFPDAKKSWLQFDLTSVYAADSSIKGYITNAKLTVYGGNTSSSGKRYTLYGLKDAAGLENWVSSALTWNTGPGNDITQGKTLNATLTTPSFYTMTIPSPGLDVMTETPAENQAALTTFMNTDTDGKVTFIFTAGDTSYLWNVGQPLEPFLTLTYLLGNALDKAHDPNPVDGAVVETTLGSLSWTNPSPKVPGGVITCDVYLGKGTEPNFISMDKKPLSAGVSSVSINTANFPQNGSLTNMRNYCWVVDVHDSSDPNVIKGQAWSFYTNNNLPPVITAMDDKVVWLGKSGIAGQEVVPLSTTVSDDGLPNPPAAMTYTWSQVANGAPTVAPSPTNTLNTSVTITARGSYEFQIMANDSNRQSTKTIKVYVGTSACDAVRLSTATDYDAGDFNHDCDVNMLDLMILVNQWLKCSDTTPYNCGR